MITNTCLTPVGWTLLAGPTDTTGWRTYIFWKRAASSSETNPLCNWTATSADKYAQVHTIRGAITTGSPFAASALSADVTDTIASTGVTSAAASQLIVVVGIGSDNASASMVSVVSTDPSSYTQRHYSTITTGADATGWCFTATRTTAGATGTVTQDFNSTMPAAGVLVAAITDPPAPQTVAVTGRTSVSTYGAVSITVGAVTQAVTGRTSVSSFGPTSPAAGNVTVTVAGRTSLTSFGTVTAAIPAQTVAVTGTTSASGFAAATPSAGGVTVQGAGRTSQSSFGSVEAFPGGVLASMAGWLSLSSYGTATVSVGGVTIQTAGLTSGSTYGVGTPGGGSNQVLVLRRRRR